jgi:hypothetical protein
MAEGDEIDVLEREAARAEIDAAAAEQEPPPDCATCGDEGMIAYCCGHLMNGWKCCGDPIESTCPDGGWRGARHGTDL